MKTWSTVSGLLAAWAVCAAAAGAAEPPLPADIFFKPASLQEVLLSPSGKRMAVSTPGANGRLGVFVIDLQGCNSKATRPVLSSDSDVPRCQVPHVCKRA